MIISPELCPKTNSWYVPGVDIRVFVIFDSSRVVLRPENAAHIVGFGYACLVVGATYTLET